MFKISVPDMMCEHCVKRINDALNAAELKFDVSLPDKTVLSCKSICLEDEQFELRRFVNHSKENPDYDRRPFLRFFRGKGTDEYVYTLGFRFPEYALTSPTGWEWFDPIRSDPRFAAYVERVKAVFAPVENEA